MKEHTFQLVLRTEDHVSQDEAKAFVLDVLRGGIVSPQDHAAMGKIEPRITHASTDKTPR